MNRPLGLRAAQLVPWVGFAVVTGLFPVPALSQTTPKTTLHCYACQEVDWSPTYADTECVGSQAPGAQLACSQWYSGGGWRCFLYGGACPDSPMEAVPLADLGDLQGVGSWVEEVAMIDGAPPVAWVLRSCSGAAVAEYVQTPNDRFVPVSRE